MRVWTVATPGELSHARVLVRSVAEAAPGTRTTVVLAGPRPGHDDELDLIALEDLAPDLQRAARSLPWRAVGLMARARVLGEALARSDEPVVLLDPGMDVRADLEPFAEALERSCVALVPRLLGQMPSDGHIPCGGDVVAAGLHTPAVIGARAGDETTEFLTWWEDHLVDTTRQMGHGELAALRRAPSLRLNQWLDLAPSRFEALTVVEHAGLCVSAWNLHQHRLAMRPRGPMTVDGEPLRLVHFDGFDPEKRHWLCADADRVRVPDHPVLDILCDSYGERLIEAGWEPFGGVRVGTALDNGLVFDRRLAHLHEQASIGGQTFGSLATPEGATAFCDWLESPADRGAQHGLNRVTEHVWGERGDVPRAYKDLDGSDGAEYVRWLWEWGRHELALPDRFLPPHPDFVSDAERDTTALGGVRVIGYMRGALGLGAAARAYTDALRAEGAQVRTTTVTPPRAATGPRPTLAYAEVDYADDETLLEPEPVHVLCVNADELPALAEQLGDGLRGTQRTIGIWAWETDDVPARWDRAYDLVDEIWTYSRYVAQSLSRVAPVPVIPIPIPVAVPEPPEHELDLGFPDGFQFLFAFDFLSTPARKYPEGLIRAFCRAFAPGEGPQLVIKTLHGALRPMWFDRLRWLARDRADIHIVDRALSGAERDALMAGCDCYVSLHRAEGFGLTIAEAMALGKPVIATAYSGNLDFMTPMNGYLVEYALTRVGPDGEQYPPNGTWADPDLEHAAHLMRHVYEHPEEARAKGERARRTVAETLSADAVGRLIGDRLRRLERSGATRSGATRSGG
jgi:glycosyltransferase involved in cell wall biosynthesis